MERVKVGGYFTDSIGGTREWIEYNPKCIIFYGGNKYEGFYYVKKVFDIATMQSLNVPRKQIEEQYGIKIPSNIEIPNIENVKVKKRYNENFIRK